MPQPLMGGGFRRRLGRHHGRGRGFCGAPHGETRRVDFGPEYVWRGPRRLDRRPWEKAVGDDPPQQVPVLVLTPSSERRDRDCGGTTFHFVTGRGRRRAGSLVWVSRRPGRAGRWRRFDREPLLVGRPHRRAAPGRLTGAARLGREPVRRSRPAGARLSTHRAWVVAARDARRFHETRAIVSRQLCTHPRSISRRPSINPRRTLLKSSA